MGTGPVGDGGRPMTSNKGAGYSSKQQQNRMFDPMNMASFR